MWRMRILTPISFIRLRDKHDILVVEVKMEGADSNRNKAKYRDGLQHFATLKQLIEEAGEPWS